MDLRWITIAITVKPDYSSMANAIVGSVDGETPIVFGLNESKYTHPEELLEFIRRKLKDLPADERVVIIDGSVIGTPFLDIIDEGVTAFSIIAQESARDSSAPGERTHNIRPLDLVTNLILISSRLRYQPHIERTHPIIRRLSELKPVDEIRSGEEIMSLALACWPHIGARSSMEYDSSVALCNRTSVTPTSGDSAS